jgi:hypothetical protein
MGTQRACFLFCIFIFVLGCHDSDFDEGARRADPSGTPLRSSPFENLRVGTADGPEGRTDVQVAADFEDGQLGPNAALAQVGFRFDPSQDFALELGSGGPGASAHCMKLRGTPGAEPDGAGGAVGLATLSLSGPKGGESPGLPAARRANSHSVRVQARSEAFLQGEYNLRITGRLPLSGAAADAESPAAEPCFDIQADWGGTWREILVRDNPSSDLGDVHRGGYSALLDLGDLWPGLDDVRWEFVATSSALGEEGILLDDFVWFYENPFLASFPQVSVRWAQPGMRAVHPVVVWNTHPARSRSFLIRAGGWRHQRAEWWGDAVAITDMDGQPIDRTGPLGPGQGFRFDVAFDVPETRQDGAPHEDGDSGTLLLSVFEDPADVRDLTPHERVRLDHHDFRSSYDMPGVGVVLRTLVHTGPDLPAVAPPPAVTELAVLTVGATWADLAWRSPDESRAALAYAVRVSAAPIHDETSWNAAVPVEGMPPVLGARVQNFSLRGLRSGMLHHAAVRVYNETGEGSEFASMSFITAGAPFGDDGSDDEDEPSTDGNSPPVITEAVPSAEVVEVSVDSSVVFSIVATDAEGDPIATVWTLDGDPLPDAVFSVTYQPRMGDEGEHSMTVRVSDGQRHAASLEERSWQVFVGRLVPPVPDPIPPDEPEPEPSPEPPPAPAPEPPPAPVPEPPPAPAPPPAPDPVSALVTWQAPTTNADGSPLTDLAGYRIYYGRFSGMYTGVVDVGNVTSFRVENLLRTRYFFSVTAYDRSGNESAFARETFIDLQ